MIFKYIAYLSSFVLLFPLIAAFRSFKGATREIKVICLHVFVAALFEILSRWLWLHKQNNLFLLHMYTFWEMEVISLFYLMIFPKGLIRYVMLLLMVLFEIFVWADALYIDGWHRFNVYARPIACIIIMLYAIVYLTVRLSDVPAVVMIKDPVLLVNIAFVFYFSVCFFLFLLSNYVLHESAKRHAVWAMHTGLAWIYYTVIGCAIWKVRTP